MLNTLLAALLFTFAFGQCIYTDTECQCIQAQAGRTCLRYFSGSGASTQCETYECGAGYVCDCSGNEMCDITDCSLLRSVYRPIGAATLPVGQIVSCQLASQVTCVTQQNLLVPSPAAAPSSSTSAIPVVPEPSSSQAAGPLASASPSGSGVTASVPSSSPSPFNGVIVPLGGVCDVTSTCETGTACSCLSLCSTVVSLEVEAVGDDKVSPWICGTELGPPTVNFQDRGSWTYTGPCSDLYFKVNDFEGIYSGVAAAVREVGTTTWFPTALAGGSGLSGTAGHNITGTGFFTNPNYDFTSWLTVVQQTSLGAMPSYVNINQEYGSETWTYQNGFLGNGDMGDTWYRTTLPFC